MIILATLKKEIQEVLRDKRTLLLILLVPMVFYPALILLAGGLGAKQQQQEEIRKITIGATANQATQELIKILNTYDPNTQWKAIENPDIQQLLAEHKIDLFAEISKPEDSATDRSHYSVYFHHYSTAKGETDLKRAEATINSYTKAVVEEKLGKIVSIKYRQDYATVRESAGSKFGGMAAYFLVFLAFTGCMAVAVDVAAGEKERGTLEAMLTTPAPFNHIAIGKLLFVMIMGILSVISTASGIGIMVLIAGSSIKGMSLGGVSILAILAMIFLLLILIFFFAVLLFGLSILAKSSKEAHMRSSLLLLVVAMALVYCTLPGVSLKGGILFIPVLNVAIALRALWEGTLTIVDYLVVIGSILLLSAIIITYISKKVRGSSEKILLK